MLIAILSDSHDQILNLNRAVLIANERGAEVLIHCGDLISPFMLHQLELFSGKVHLIYGNNVGDQHIIASRCNVQGKNLSHHGIIGRIVVDSLRIGFHHYPEVAKDLAGSGEFDIVCCGHNHLCEVKQVNGCLLVNPGDLLGKENPPGFLLLDTGANDVYHVTVGTPMDFSREFHPEYRQVSPQPVDFGKEPSRLGACQ